MSDLIETGDIMKQVAVSRYSGTGSLIFSNIPDDDPRFLQGTAPVFITAIINGFHIEVPMVPEESGEGRRPYVMVNAQIDSISGAIGGMNRTLVFAEHDAQKFSFYYPISDEELQNMISDGIFRYKTFADTLAAQMKDEYREVSFSCDLDYSLFLKSAGDFSSKQILICDPVSIFHDRSFLEPSVDFIPPGIQENDKVYGLSFHLDEASEAAGKICAETDQEERSIRSVNEVKIRDLNDDILNSILSSEQIAALLNDMDNDKEDEYVPDAALWEDPDEEKLPELRKDDPLFTWEPMADEPGPDDLLEEDEPEEDTPAVPEVEEKPAVSVSTDTLVFSKGNELSESVKMTEEMKAEKRAAEEKAAREEAEAKAKQEQEIDALFAEFDDFLDEAQPETNLEAESDVEVSLEPEPEVKHEQVKKPTTPDEFDAEGEKLQQKAEDAGLYMDDEDENELFTDK